MLFFSDFAEQTQSVAFFHCFSGDFNAYNQLWGNNHLYAKGRGIGYLDSSDLVLLNDESGTQLNLNSSWSILDFSMVFYKLATKCIWQVHDDNFENDHFSILISLLSLPWNLIYRVAFGGTPRRLICNVLSLTVLQISLKPSAKDVDMVNDIPTKLLLFFHAQHWG